MHYSLRGDESLEYSDLKKLEKALEKALSGKLLKETLIDPLEPYMQFIVTPRDKRDFGPVLDWRIHPWADSDNSESFWDFQLDAEKMIMLLTYLQLQHQEISWNDAKVKEFAENGIFYESVQKQELDTDASSAAKTEFIIADVSFSYGIGKNYTYISDLTDLHEGDEVLVPVGVKNDEKKAWIKEIRELPKNQKQYYLENYKRIICLLYKAAEYPDTPPKTVFCPVLQEKIKDLDCLENRDTAFGKKDKPENWEKICERCLWYDY